MFLSNIAGRVKFCNPVINLAIIVRPGVSNVKTVFSGFSDLKVAFSPRYRVDGV